MNVSRLILYNHRSFKIYKKIYKITLINNTFTPNNIYDQRVCIPFRWARFPRERWNWIKNQIKKQNKTKHITIRWNTYPQQGEGVQAWNNSRKRLWPDRARFDAPQCLPPPRPNYSGNYSIHYHADRGSIREASLSGSVYEIKLGRMRLTESPPSPHHR